MDDLSPPQDASIADDGHIERVLVARPAGMSGVEVWQHLSTNRRFRAVTEGVWLATSGYRTRWRAWTVNRYRGRSLELAGDAFALLDPNEPILCERTSGHIDIVSLIVSPEYLARLFPEGRPSFSLAAVRDAALDSLFWVAVETLTNPSVEPIEREESLNDLLFHAHTLYGLRPLTLDSATHDSVALARELIEARYEDRLSLDEIASAAKISKYYLAHKFRELVGLPMHQYQTLLRVREALRRLRTDEALADVALACGFADQAHLTRVLRQTLGFTPATYRMGMSKSARIDSKSFPFHCPRRSYRSGP